nr:MAG TPA: hypothetical protein [Caudoviricetes sp.]
MLGLNQSRALFRIAYRVGLKRLIWSQFRPIQEYAASSLHITP